MKRIFIILAAAVTACTTAPRGLQEAERLLEEAPDSSLAVLERIAPASLRGRSQRAAYTLLHARAEEACFGFIPSEETAALEEAAEYYEAAGDAPQRVAAWYRLGRLQAADGALSRAIVSFEKALAAAREAKDIEAEGDVRRELAYTYNASLQHVAAARELYASWQAYDRAGEAGKGRRVLLEYGQAWYNFERYDEAEEIFRAVLSEAVAAADTLTQVRCLQSYAALALEKTPADPDLAREMLGRVQDDLLYPLSSADWGVLAYAASLQGRDAEAQRCLAHSRARMETVGDRNRLRFRQYQVDARAGRTAEALKALEDVTAYGNEEDVSALRSAVSLAREDYLQGRRALSEERLRATRMGIWALLMLAIGVASTLLWFLRARRIEAARALAEEKAETERYIGIAEELQARLSDTARQLKQTASGKNEILERLCEQYYIFEGTDKLQGNLLKEARQAIEGLRDDPKVHARLEQAVDAAHDGAASKLRAQLPGCKEDDVRLFVLAASGFSRTAMATLLDKEKGVVNNRLWRLKGRIADSGAPDKELLAGCLD
ncbi:hypothetical protein SAMN06298214_1207 [Bacteroidales bacterium WCE2004]|nr:hypothetical protein SAMN06298214_1207 [Bacteroidales bacterium WCE2004]